MDAISFHRSGGPLLGVAAALIALAITPRATRAGDDEAAAKAAAEADRYAWVQADSRFGSDGREAALAFAAERRGPDIERLRAYLKEAVDQPEQRELFARIAKLFVGREFAKLVEVLAPIELGRKTLLDARIWRLKAISLQIVKKPGEALSAMRTWYAISRELGWLRGQAESLKGEFQILDGFHRYAEMADVSRRLAEVEGQRGHEKEMRIAQLDRTGCLIESGRVREAMKVLPAPLEATVTHGWKDLEAVGRQTLATAYWRQGEFAAALFEAERADALWRELDSSDGRISCAILLGAIRQDAGDFEAAEEDLRRADEALGDGRTVDRAFVRGNLGYVAWRLGRNEEAIGLLRDTVTVLERQGDPAKAALARRDLGEVLADAGHTVEAREVLVRAVPGLASDPPSRAEVLTLLADNELHAGGTAKAEQLLAKARLIEGGAEERRVLYRMLELEGRILLEKGESTKAVDSLRKAMDLVEDSASGLPDEQTFAVRAQRARLFRLAVQSAFRTGRPELALESMERSRAAVLRESMGQRRAFYRAALPVELAARLREAEANVVEARRALLDARRGESREAAEKATAGLEKAEGRLRKIANGAELAFKRLAGIARTDPVPLARLQEELQPFEALVYYALEGDVGRALVVTKKRAYLRELGASAPLRAAVGRAEVAMRSAADPVPWDALRSSLVRPLALPRNLTRVMVCPDGAVAFLPWPVLLEGAYASTVPSGSTFVMLRRRGGAPGSAILAFGAPNYEPSAVVASADVPRGLNLQPLQHADEEIQEIARDGDTCYLAKEATEKAVRTALAGERHWWSIHFACHGVVDTRFPRRSALVLARDESNDGFLTIPEILALDVSTDLVVLSACDSGGGKFIRGEGVVGLARAFMAAGAPRVLASHWKVNDAATKELMVRFYESRRKGRTPAAALREAQAALRRKEGLEHPYFWAAWSIWGLPD